jgi:branched-chain amino acid transport system ATP-binding protein
MMPAARNAGPGLLQLDRVGVRSCGGWALEGMTLEVQAGEAIGVLGRRGSGKTALLDLISGFLRPRRGRLTFAGEDITRWAPHRIARAGVARSFQDAPEFDGLSVRDAVFAAAVGRGLERRGASLAVDTALVITGLAGEEDRAVAALGHAELRLLCVARVAAAAPRLALLDEPLAGLAPAAAGRVVSALRRLHGLGTAMIVTGHDPASLRVVCSRSLFLHDGRLAGGGRSGDVIRA